MSLYIYDEYRRAVVKSDTATPEYINLDAREGSIIAKHLTEIDNLWESNKQKQSQLAAANARIAELEAQVDGEGIVRTLAELGMQLESANARIAELEAQLAKPATIHEVIDDFGETVTAVTL